MGEGWSGESPRERIDRLISTGQVPAEAVDRAIDLWEHRLRQGVIIPSGERVTVTLEDLLHVIVDPRIWRRPERIVLALTGIFEIRTALLGRRFALARWDEGTEERAGYAILMADGGLRTLHVIDERTLRKRQRKGELLWKR